MRDKTEYRMYLLSQIYKKCDPIDARIKVMSQEFIDMVDEFNDLEMELDKTEGFFNKLKIRWLMYKLDQRININNSVIKKLYRTRIDITDYYVNKAY